MGLIFSIFRPRHTLKSVVGQLVNGLESGDVILESNDPIPTSTRSGFERRDVERLGAAEQPVDRIPVSERPTQEMLAEQKPHSYCSSHRWGSAA